MRNEDGLRIACTPVQLAAAMQGATITEPEGWLGRLGNRVEGGATLIGGGIELAGSAALFAAPEPTMLTKVAGWGLLLHGSDTSATGLVEIWTGRHHITLTEQSVAAGARAIGFDPERSDKLGATVDTLVPILMLGPLAAARPTAVKAGRFAIEESTWLPSQQSRFVDLDAQEAEGGHTVARHIGKDEAFLRQRLADPKFRGAAATSFRTLEDAEKYLSRALMSERPAIEAWASNARIGANKLFSYSAGETVGYGITKSTGMMTNMSRLSFRLEKFADQSKIYFVITAFPAL